MSMNASAQLLAGMLMNAGQRFAVSVCQRPHSWDREHGEQLRKDILAVGRRGGDRLGAMP